MAANNLALATNPFDRSLNSHIFLRKTSYYLIHPEYDTSPVETQTHKINQTTGQATPIP
jgi:hypothetical protein